MSETGIQQDNPQEMKQERDGVLAISGFLGIVGGILLAGGVWLPWLKAFLITATGYGKMGEESLILVTAGAVSFVMGLAGAAKKTNYSLLFAVFGFGGLVYLGFAYIRITGQLSDLGIGKFVSMATGFWVCAIGALVLIVAWLVGKEKKTD